jgi:hypothetical protein
MSIIFFGVLRGLLQSQFLFGELIEPKKWDDNNFVVKDRSNDQDEETEKLQEIESL